MKHTDFYNKVKEIKRQEQRELKEALKAHGGRYSWYNEDYEEFVEEYPCIAVNANTAFPNPTDIDIRAVSVDKDGKLWFEGEDKEWGNEVNFCADDVFAGHLGYIIDLIPETDAVNDVTSKKEDFTVATICRDDLVNTWYDAKNLSDQDMQNIADVMGDLYCNYSYHEDLLIAARKLGLKQLNNE